MYNDNEVSQFIYGFDKFDESMPVNSRFKKLTFKNPNGVSFELGRLNEGKLVRLQNGAAIVRTYSNSLFGAYRISLAIRVRDTSIDSTLLTVTANNQQAVLIAIENKRFIYKHKDNPRSELETVDMRAANNDEWIYLEICNKFFIENSSPSPSWKYGYQNATINGITHIMNSGITVPDLGTGKVESTIEIGDIGNKTTVDVDDMYCSDGDALYSYDGKISGLFVSAKVRDIPIETVEGDPASVTGADNALQAVNDSSDKSFVNITNAVSFTTGVMLERNQRQPYKTIASYDVRTTEQGVCDVSIQSQSPSSNSWYQLDGMEFMPDQEFSTYTYVGTGISPAKIRFSFR
ncbi:hypothetical protein ACPV36_04840 [Photobacterium damselae]|uniref:hypothetical protein n=1 Tax=Photobacterium damselae TaxID=38293 RepID=UPI00406837D3